MGFPESGTGEEHAFALLVAVIADLEKGGTGPPLSGLKDQLRKRDPEFSEKEFGFNGFLQFCKAAKAAGWPVNPDLLTGLLVPVVAAGVWLGLRRMHRRMNGS